MRSKKLLQCEIGDIFDEAQEQFVELKFNLAAKNKVKMLDLETFLLIKNSDFKATHSRM